LAADTLIAITQGTGQGGNDFWTAAAVLADLIADFVGGRPSHSFIGIIQSIDEGRHDFWIADAVITITELTESSTSLTSIAGRLRGIDQLGDIARICIAAFRFDSGTSRSTRSSRSAAGGSTA
jgi:hypothetical protein